MKKMASSQGGGVCIPCTLPLDPSLLFSQKLGSSQHGMQPIFAQLKNISE